MANPVAKPMNQECPICFESKPHLIQLSCCRYRLCSDCSKTESSACPNCRVHFDEGKEAGMIFRNGKIRCDECLVLKRSNELWFCKDCKLMVCSHCVINAAGGHTSHERLAWDSMQPLHAALQRFRAREKGYGPERIAEVESKLSEIFEEMRPAVLTEIQNRAVVCNTYAREELDDILGQLYSLNTWDDGSEVDGFEDPEEDWDLKILEKALALGSRPEAMRHISEIREGMKGRLMLMPGKDIVQNYREYLTTTRSTAQMRASNNCPINANTQTEAMVQIRGPQRWVVGILSIIAIAILILLLFSAYNVSRKCEVDFVWKSVRKGEKLEVPSISSVKVCLSTIREAWLNSILLPIFLSCVMVLFSGSCVIFGRFYRP